MQLLRPAIARIAARLCVWRERAPAPAPAHPAVSHPSAPLRSAALPHMALVRRRRFSSLTLAVVLSLGAGAAVWAQPMPGRMDPGEREQLRRELRQRGADGARRNDGGPQRLAPPDAPDRGQRMSPEEREQLRRQLREAHADERGRRRRD